MSYITVYHTTPRGNARRIVEKGWEVTLAGTNIYGRGIYFWELVEDAHVYGHDRFGPSAYEIVAEAIPITSENSVTYDHDRARGRTIDGIAKGLLRRTIDVVVISNPQIEGSTLSRARGRAFLWLVDIDTPVRVVKF